MYRIGEFSKIAKTTVRTLRYYDDTGLLKPEFVDEWTNYRYYTTKQLYPLQKIISLRQAGLTIDEIRSILGGEDIHQILSFRKKALEMEKQEVEERLVRINFLIHNYKEAYQMDYQALVKKIPSYPVYYRRGVIRRSTDISSFILSAEQEFREANPDIHQQEENYCFISYLDGEYKDENIEIEYVQSIKNIGNETANVKCKTLNCVDAVCVYHKGSYEKMNEAYAYAFNWLKQNGYAEVLYPRESYINGAWNRDSVEDWLTEIQIPVNIKR